MINKGERVKIISGCPDKLSVYLNTIQTVKNCSGEVVTMVGLPDKLSNGQGCWWTLDELEVIPMQTAEFQKGDKVRVVRTINENNRHLVGRTGEITKVYKQSDSDEYPYKTTITGDFWFAAEELELIPAEEPKYLTKQQALKAAIDGQLIQNMDWHEITRENPAYAYFDGEQFMYHSYTDDEDEDWSCVETDGNNWRIYSKPFVPKFYTRQFFTNPDGDYGRVLEITKDGYMVTFNGNRTKLKYTEDKMTEVE